MWWYIATLVGDGLLLSNYPAARGAAHAGPVLEGGSLTETLRQGAVCAKLEITVAGIDGSAGLQRKTTRRDEQRVHSLSSGMRFLSDAKSGLLGNEAQGVRTVEVLRLLNARKVTQRS